MMHCSCCDLVYCRCPSQAPQQPMPPPPDPHQPTIFELVHFDLDQRERKGTETYGRPLQAFDGRNSLWDAYEEALDLAMYLRKKIREETGK